MPPSITAKSFIFRFSDVSVREREFSIEKAGALQQVEPKAFRVLLILLRNPRRLLPKEELLNAVWGDAAVTENSLTRAIALLRRVLDDDAREPRFIETVATVGYRWLSPVELSEESAGDSAARNGLEAAARNGNAAAAGSDYAAMAAAGSSAPSVAVATAGRKRWAWVTASGAVSFGLLAVGYWYWSRPWPPPRVTSYTQITFDGGEKNLVGTDGARIYFGRANTMFHSVSAVPSAGGASIEIPIAIPNDVALEDVSPDGANLLIGTDAYGHSNVHPQWIVRTLDGVPVHPLPEGSWSASISPDGKSVVYSTHDGNLWLVGIDGSGARRIASLNAVVSELAWSPDGSRIRFTREKRLREIRSDGSHPHPLLTDWQDSHWQCCGRWTSDGSMYVFLSQSRGSISPEIWALDERRGILRRPPSAPMRLAPGPIRWTTVLPAKDPKTLYATGEVLRGELVRFDSRTQQYQPFLGGISAQGALFSPDGRSVIYVTFPDGFLFRANADGSNPVQLTDAKFAVFRPTWSPDGTQIVFEDKRSDLSAIYLISSAGGAAQRVIPGDAEPENDPTWSPDGKRMAFSIEVPEMPKYRIRVIDLTTHAVSDLPGSTGVYSPRWSPDGRSIAALTHDGLNIKVFDTITQTWTTVVQNTWVGYPTWSRDGRWLYFESADLNDKYSIQRVRIAGGKPELVAPLPVVNAAGWWGWYGLDATDSPLIMRDIGKCDIYALSLDAK